MKQGCDAGCGTHKFVLTMQINMEQNEGAMKSASFVTLFILFVTISCPMSVTVAPIGADPFLIGDDVCDASGVAFSVNGDHPLLQSGLCVVSCPSCAGFADTGDGAYRQFLIPSLKDQPPES